MLSKYLLICSTLLTFFITQAQNNPDNTTWITKNDFTLMFVKNSSHLTDMQFASNYEIKGDTLHFKHDFSYITEVSIGDKPVPREDFELPDSYFIIQHMSADSLTLKAINPTALYMVNRLTNNYYFNFSDKQIIQWEKGEKPDYVSSEIDNSVTFWNQKTIEKVRQIHTIELSTTSDGWTGSGYYDVVISEDLSYSCRMISKGYSKNDRAKTTYYKGQLSDSEFERIEACYGKSSLPDSGAVDYSRRWASHDQQFEMKIVHDYGVTFVSGNRTSLPDFVRPLFDSVHGDFITDADEVKQISQSFPLTQFEKEE